MRNPRLGGDSSNAVPPPCGEPDNHISQDKQMDRRPTRKSFRAVRCPALVVESAGTPPSGRLETCDKRGTETSRTWRCAIAPSAMRTVFSTMASDESCQRTIATKATSGASCRTPSGEDRSIRRTPAPAAPDAAIPDGLGRGPFAPLRWTFDRREREPLLYTWPIRRDADGTARVEQMRPPVPCDSGLFKLGSFWT